MKEFHYKYKKSSTHVELEQYVYRLGIYHYNWHRDLELFLLLTGKAEVCSGGVSRIFEAGDMILINANEGHTTMAPGGDTIAMVIHLDPVSLKEYYSNVEYLSFHLCSQDSPGQRESFDKIRRDMARMMLSFGQGTPEKKLLYQRSFYDLLYTIVSEFPPEKIRSAAFKANLKNMDSIQGMVKYINRNYHKKISLDSLAKERGYNPSYVSQLFKTCVGINFYDYLTRIRLREATLALSQSDEKILDIALAHGFADLKAFNTSFKETFQKSPTEYRKRLNLENRGNDPFFKKKFLEEGEPLVTGILEEYAALGPGRGEEKSPGQSPKRQEDHGEKEDEGPKNTANPPWERLERIAAELLDTAAGLKMEEEKNREKLGI